MISRTRLSPGIEAHEIDRSQYNNKPDYSITGTTTAIFGWADKGEDYATQWINTMTTFVDTFGHPTCEVERYFFNAANEVIGRGGICLASKLPYDNESLDSYIEASYKLGDLITLGDSDIDSKDIRLSCANSVDKTLTSLVEISFDKTKKISIDRLDGYMTNNMVDANEIKIVDITRSKYEKISMLSSSNDYNRVDRELVGIMPVIVSPVEAMAYQGLIQLNTSFLSTSEDDPSHETTEHMSAFTVVVDGQNRKSIAKSLSAEYSYTKFSEFSPDSFSQALSSDSIYDYTVSKQAASYFPLINYIGADALDKSMLKKVGLVVFKTSVDTANNRKLKFTPVESYVGSLDKNSKNSFNSSDFIGDIINSSSTRIRWFSNIRAKSRPFKDASLVSSARQVAPVLGFAECECKKNITLINSVTKPLARVLDQMKDSNQVNIDLVCDGGVSNIAAFCERYATNAGDDITNAQQYPLAPSGTQSSVNWSLDEKSRRTWFTVLKMFDDFTKGTRRDCLFLADVLRPFCLDGNEKRVRTTKIDSSIEKDIIPNLRYLNALNSSWSAGYSNWMYIQDADSGDYFWCPPSVKAAGACTYTDAYFHKWDAPAGMTRGVVRDAVDVAFNPMGDEAGKIYQQAWNYAVNYPLEGVVIEGQKTFQLQSTALDRVNVRRLMIYLEKSVTRVARRFLYEGNTAFLRQRFVDTIKEILEDAKTGAGIIDYAIRCDDTLNTSEVIDRNELRCIICVKPVKCIENIVLSFILTNQSASVTEEVMR